MTRKQEKDTASAVGNALAWAYRIMAISACMVLPILGGVWLDGLLNTRIVFLLLGVATGLTLGIVLLVGIARGAQADRTQHNSRSEHSDS